MKQVINALAPSNWVFTNPELLRETFASDGDNLVRGMQFLAEDIKRGGGDLQIRQTDLSKFEVGRNLARHARQSRISERARSSSSSMRRLRNRCSSARF